MPARSLNTSLPCSAKPRLTAFSGLKALAVIGIIACHMGALPGWDLCARMVEVLFLVSGFCMAYNHFCPSDTPAARPSGWQIVKAKLPRLYPVHFATFLLQLFFVPAWSSQTIGFILSFGLLNLTLQHAWFQSTQFMFNNVSWFLSALLFCYFITPPFPAPPRAPKPPAACFCFLPCSLPYACILNICAALILRISGWICTPTRWYRL